MSAGVGRPRPARRRACSSIRVSPARFQAIGACGLRDETRRNAVDPHQISRDLHGEVAVLNPMIAARDAPIMV